MPKQPDILPIYRIELPCPHCGEKDLQLLRELVDRDSIACSFCGGSIDLTPEHWQTLIRETLETLSHIRIISPKSD